MDASFALPSIDSNPQPPQPSQGRNRDLLVPWLLVAGLFVASLITAIATMLHGMARIGIDKANLPWWFHPLTLISECGLILSTAGILALVIVSFRRALKSQ